MMPLSRLQKRGVLKRSIIMAQQDHKEFDFNQSIKPDELTDANIKHISDNVVRTLAEASKKGPIDGGAFINVHIRIGKPPHKVE